MQLKVGFLCFPDDFKIRSKYGFFIVPLSTESDI